MGIIIQQLLSSSKRLLPNVSSQAESTTDLTGILSIAVILAIIIIGVLIILFLIKIGKENKKNEKHALGLPPGSIRAIIALTVIVSFVLLALYFYLTADTASRNDLAKTVLTLLGTLVVAVSSFYFGIKATEQGSKIAQDAFNNINENYTTENKITEQIIIEAIANNKGNWLETYKCTDIKLGKKVSKETQFELNCIVFIVKKKDSSIEKQYEIPPLIPYNSQGKEYKIPTDVAVQTVDTITSKFIGLPIARQKQILKSVKEELIPHWVTEFDNLQSVSIGQKIVEGEPQKFFSFIFQVEAKKPLTEIQNKVPPYIEYEFEGINYFLPTDIEEVGETTAEAYKATKNKIVINSQPYQPGCSIGRVTSSKSRQSTGTLGLKVQKKNSNLGDPKYILSCYHVLCSEELGMNELSFKSDSSSATIFAPGPKDGAGELIAHVKEGALSPTMDAAIAMIDNNILVDSIPYETFEKPTEIRKLNDNDEKTLSVKLIGRTSNVQFGRVIENWTFTNLKYSNSNLKHSISGVIMTTKISKSGDSGAAVFDREGKVIGIVVSGNSKYTYIIPITRIFNNLNLELCDS